MTVGSVPQTVGTKLKREKISGTNQEAVVLSDGNRMPLLGLGTAGAKGENVQQIVEHALTKSGYKHIDTAAMYGNEQDVGKALQSAKREDYYLVTKLGNTDHGRVAEAMREQLQKLGVDYVDQYLMHWPLSDKVTNGKLDPSIEETWREMEKLVDQGLVKSIGVSNFSVKKLKDLQSYARIQPQVNQVEVHVWHRNPLIVKHCNNTGVAIVAYSPAGGIPVYEGKRPWEDPIVKEVANNKGKSPFQVLLRWNLQYGSTIIPKTTKIPRVDENIDIWDWSLNEDEFLKLSNLSTQVRMGHGEWFLKDSPYTTLDDLWDGETGNWDSPK